MLRCPGALTKADFLHRYWQRRPLFIPGGLPLDLPVLDADELAWLATLDDVESRLIITERSGDACQYRMQHGPFSSEQLAALPDADWTLLVQDVEKHLPDFRAWLDCVDFIPDWRVDDLMVSFAAPGGSAGPHRDNYDVLLCQTAGVREWQITTAAAPVREVRMGELALLEPFVADSRHAAVPGDILYLPPGAPHWGIAQDACLTYSIGMRAPTQSEFSCAFERLYPGDPVRDAPTGGQRTAPQFYQDPDLGTGESLPGQISAETVLRARRSFPQFAAIDAEALIVTLGCVVTDLKAWLAPEQPDEAETEAALRQISCDTTLPVHGMARLAWYAGEEGNMAFANGHSQAVSGTELEFMQVLCRQRRLDPAAVALLACGESRNRLLSWLLTSGVLDLSDDAIRNHSD